MFASTWIEQPVEQRRLDDADGVGQARGDQHHVEQGRVVGGDDQRPGAAQAVEFRQIETAGAAQPQEGEVKAKAGQDRPPPERLPEAARQ